MVHFDAALVGSVSLSLVAVMGPENALMAVMRLDVVSYCDILLIAYSHSHDRQPATVFSQFLCIRRHL